MLMGRWSCKLFTCRKIQVYFKERHSCCASTSPPAKVLCFRHFLSCFERLLHWVSRYVWIDFAFKFVIAPKSKIAAEAIRERNQRRVEITTNSTMTIWFCYPGTKITLSLAIQRDIWIFHATVRVIVLLLSVFYFAGITVTSCECTSVFANTGGR